MLDGGSRQQLINLTMFDDDILFNWTMTGGEEEEILKEIVQLWITQSEAILLLKASRKSTKERERR